MITITQKLTMKRLFDLIFSLIIFIITIPVFVMIMLCIRFSSFGSIFFIHERIGKDGKPFKCYKFRTMYKDSNDRLKLILSENPQIESEWKRLQKIKNDPRVTPIGHFLRKTSLDELPQFWNVIKGDLSVVGPRPVTSYELLHHYGEKKQKILSVKPGITGLWQISGRNDVSYQQRIFLDEQYIDNQNCILDLKIIIKTIPIVFTNKGAY